MKLHKSSNQMLHLTIYSTIYIKPKIERLCRRFNSLDNTFYYTTVIWSL